MLNLEIENKRRMIASRDISTKLWSEFIIVIQYNKYNMI